MKSHVTKMLGVVVLAMLAAGCATGPKFTEMESTIAPPRPDMGRIFIYRLSAVGAAVQPKIFLNDEVVGKAVPKGFFYIDVPPGTHQLRTTTEVKRTLSMTLEAGEVRYVKLKVAMGFFIGHVNPRLVDAAIGQKEISKCKYTGDK